ncbi:MAG: 23S rRNA-/tRNA-specific pseudouridylate synthase [Bradymonadia bacterium]|jgi:23S rRNA-/tRNA-specific pseudouridylate synthase
MNFHSQLCSAGAPPLHLCRDLLIVNKTAGLPSDQTRDPQRDTLFSRVQSAWRDAGEPGDKPALMHRLDRDTTGCVLFALSAAARASVTEALRARAFDKRYLAVVRGAATLHVEAEPQVVTARLDSKRVGKVNRQVIVERGGQHSESRVALRQRFDTPAGYRGEGTQPRALVEVQLVTGRRHQIRVHLAHIGAPVIGDPLYSGSDACAPAPQRNAQQDASEHCEALLLHAWMLGVPESVSGGPLMISAPQPHTFTACGTPTLTSSCY